MWLPKSIYHEVWPWMPGLGRIVGAAIPGPFHGDEILSASDYGGTHPGSRFATYSFLFVDPQNSRSWFEAQRVVRKAHLADGRRMAFKSLNDRHRLEALPCFLRAADSLCGLLCTVAVHKSYARMATGKNSLAVWRRHRRLKGRWNATAFEQMMRIVLIWASLLI